MSEPARPPITPETKVGELLRQRPELEEPLIALSPEFRRLKNPVLRATVAKVATLRQVAKVGGLSVGDLVNALRRAAGEETVALDGEPGATTAPPGWLDASRIVRTLDIRPILDSGRQPIGDVLRELDRLAAGDILELLAPFEPAPLIDLAETRGFRAFVEAGEDSVRVLLTRATSGVD